MKFMFPTILKKIEYRLNEPRNNYPAIYYMENVSPLEIFCRRNTDYFILANKVYEQISTLLEEDCVVVYVEENYDETPFEKEIIQMQLGIELRLFNEKEGHPLIDFVVCQNHEEILSYLHTTYLILHGDEYEVISNETDQDRKTFAVYLKKV